MQISYNIIKTLIVAGMVTTLSTTAYAAIPNTFSPGDVITADDMNQNFSALDTKNGLQDNIITELDEKAAIPAGSISH